ncbi:MAG: diaminopimelate epimerase, partial [bacterium]
MNIEITKMHGLGNDFVMIDNLKGGIKLSAKQIRALCDRHFGVGADGLILIEKSKGADCFMNYYNSDGTTAELCANGIRCTARLYLEIVKSKKKDIIVGTRAGAKEIKVKKNNYEVNMGKPMFIHKDFPSKTKILSGLEFNFVSVGNPHAISFVKDLDSYDISKVGPKVENSTLFPNKINVELAQFVNRKYIKMKVWERGSGVTLACGTGATGVYALARKADLVDKNIEIELPGGVLKFSENGQGEILMTGPAEKVFH